jgi:Putative zinc-finger
MGAQENHISLDGPMRRILSRDSAAADPCPSPEIFAAYFEHSLDPEETERYDKHLAECSACRAVMAGIARAGTASPAHAEQHSASRWSWSGVGWLVPVAAAFATLIIAVAIYRISYSAHKPANAEVAMSRATPAPPASSSESLAESAPSAPSSTPLNAAAPPASIPPLAKSQARPQVPPPPADSSTAAALSGPAEARSADQGNVERESVTTGAAPAPSSPSVGSVNGSSATVEVTEAAPAVVAGNAAKTPAPAKKALDAAQAQLLTRNLAARPKAAFQAKDHLVVAAPDSSITWTIHTNHVQYSENGQVAPVQDFLPTNSAISAGSAPGGKVCWLVGANGAVVRATDGRSWLAANPPTNVDLTGVTATSAKSATVTASDGKSYVTTDGGQTWKAQN